MIFHFKAEGLSISMGEIIFKILLKPAIEVGIFRKCLLYPVTLMMKMNSVKFASRGPLFSTWFRCIHIVSCVSFYNRAWSSAFHPLLTRLHCQQQLGEPGLVGFQSDVEGGDRERWKDFIVPVRRHGKGARGGQGSRQTTMKV